MIDIYHNGKTFAFVGIYSDHCIGVDEDISHYQTGHCKHHVFYAIGALKTFLSENGYKKIK